MLLERIAYASATLLCLMILVPENQEAFTEKAKDLWLESRDRPTKNEAAKVKKVRSSGTDDPWWSSSPEVWTVVLYGAVHTRTASAERPAGGGETG